MYNFDSQMKACESQAAQVSEEQIDGSGAAGHVISSEILGSKQKSRRISGVKYCPCNIVIFKVFGP